MAIYTDLFWVLLPIVCVLALTWGGGPERAGALIYIAAAAATFLFRSDAPERYHGVEPHLLIIDLLMLVGLGILVTRSRRWWPIWAMAFQAISTIAHVAKALNPHLWRLGYAIMAEASSYPTLLALAAGTWLHYRRARPAKRL